MRQIRSRTPLIYILLDRYPNSTIYLLDRERSSLAQEERRRRERQRTRLEEGEAVAIERKERRGSTDR
ncbi:hypothetical protein E2562_026780 [Oryza meyeriana var. granulata]|uniref:Uncharacterized protein n=1 Tax=Oryza meyeriana var. granulata TaxID=110450 RepID=A0A6G1C9H6_9ORYZ|nr:hypothetical protein E2562_026780 [Oryza meyeriana var. granulata]